MKDITTALEAQYDVSRVRINDQIDALSSKNELVSKRQNKFDALIIASPDSTFSDRDRYVNRPVRHERREDPLVHRCHEP